jgi:hypothetical protein
MFGRTLMALVAFVGLDTSIAHADNRGTLRFGVMPLELQSSSDTPLFGEGVDRMVDKYNSAAAAYDRANGGSTERIDAADLGVTETLLVFAPGLELGGSTYFFRIEAPIGFSDEMKSVGLAMYPINLQAQLRRSLVLYASGGGSASWLDRPGTGDVGGLVVLRAAAGLRIARHIVVEVGYSAFALGGSINSERLDNMTAADAMQLQPDDVISAGEARGIVDASVGLAF